MFFYTFAIDRQIKEAYKSRMDELKDIAIDPVKLREARGERKLTKVAATIGISKQRLWNYENGLYDPPSDVIARLSLLYKIPIERLTTASEKFLKKLYTAY